MATRYEKVVLDIESSLAAVMTRDAAAAKLLERELHSLDGTSVRTSRSMSPLGDPNGPVAKTGRQSSTTSREIDKLSGRVRVLADVAAILGPGLVPIAAVGIPAITGLASQMGAAALAGGTAIVAFQGFGNALKAVNKAALEPTAQNLEAAQLAMEALSPEARSLVRELRALQPTLLGIRNAAGAGLFPGLEKSLDSLEELAPQLEDIAYVVGKSLGDVLAGGAESLTGPRWANFMGFIETEMPAALAQLAHILGSIAHGLSELWMEFDPLNDTFAGWMTQGAEAFDKWAAGLAKTEGFQSFIDYIRENGPVVGDALGSIGNALIGIVTAAAPLGGPVLKALTAVADVIADLANSDAGPSIMATVTALALLRRGMATTQAVSGSGFFMDLKGSNGAVAAIDARRKALLRVSGAAAGLTLAMSGLADKTGLSNTATLGLMGTIAGPWGAAIGAAVGLTMDLAHAQEAFKIDADSLSSTLDTQTGAITRNTEAYVASELEKQGVLRSAQDLGLSLADVTDAALGNEGALRRVTTALDAADAAMFDANGHVKVSTDSLFDFREKADQVTGAIGTTSGALDKSQGSLQRVAAATSRTADGFDQAKGAAQRFRDEINRVNAVLDRRASFRDYEAALDDFVKTLDDVKNKAKLLTKDGKINITIPKGREVAAQLDNIAGTALKVAQNLKGADRIHFLNRARADFIKVATLLLGDKDAAKALADELGLLDRKRANPKITVDTSGAYSDIANIHRALNGIPDETVFVNVQRRAGQTPGFGPQLWTGGWTGPGGKYEPKGVVHGDEFVFSKEATHGNVAMLDRLHRQLRGYAQGGYVAAAQSGPRSMSGAMSQRVSFAPAVVNIRDPWGGTQRVELIAHAVAVDVVNKHQQSKRSAKGYGQ